MNVRGVHTRLGRCVNGRVSRVCAHAGRACGTRCDAQCAEWPGRGRAPGVRCAGRACASAARVCAPRGCADAQSAGSPGVRGTGRGHCVRPRAGRPSRRCAGGGQVRTHPGSAEGPPLPLGLRLGLRLPAPGSRPASRSAHAPASSPEVAGCATAAVSPSARLGGARRGPGSRPGRGGRRELRRSPGTLPGARSALPRARPPAPSLI